MVEIQVGDWVKYAAEIAPFNRLGEAYRQGKVDVLCFDGCISLLYGSRDLPDGWRLNQTGAFSPLPLRGIIEVWRQVSRPHLVPFGTMGKTSLEYRLHWVQVYDGLNHLLWSEGAGL